MTNKDDGGPAFPTTPENARRMDGSAGAGISMRDYFAAKICAAMVSTIQNDNDYYRAAAVADRLGHCGLSEWFAADAYKQADAMIKERSK